MIIDENGEVISKGNEINKRHSWEKHGLTAVCKKCTCIKIQVDTKEFTYSKDGADYKTAPECDNSKITIIKNKKNEHRNEYRQLELFS